MKRSTLLLFFLISLLLVACSRPGQSKAIFLNNYKLVANWPKLPTDFILGNPTGIGIDTNQNIFIFHRANRKWPLIGRMPDTYISSKTILMLDRNSGKILDIWGDSIFIMPHGLTVDMNNNVWVTDVGLNQIFKFSHPGKLLMKLGMAMVSGDDSSHFNKPTDVAVAKDGSFYVSDGYGNSRIIKFSSTGHYLFEWGKKGNKEGEFNIPHAISLDDNENVYVADRENKRIQVFDPTGKFMKQWTDKDFGRICAIAFDNKTKGFVAVDDATSWFNLKHNGSNIIVFDTKGHVLNKFGKDMLNIKCWYHDVAVDDQGNIYVEDILGNTVQKFEKKSGK